MIKLTLEFKSVDEAIVALGKLVNAGAPEKQQGVTDKGVASPAAPAPDKPRRSRSDKGQARGRYKPRDNAETAKQPGEERPAPASVVPPTASAVSAPDPAAPAQPAITDPAPEVAALPYKTPQEALEALFNAKGIQAAQGALGGFGVMRARELKPEDHEKFITKCVEMMEAE